jgi:DNA-binding MarR family transcriptional regulator
MTDEINFLDLMAIEMIGPDTVVERFGGIINSSFFDASNFLGGLKIKGLVDFTTTFPGQSTIVVTEAGKHLLADAQERAKQPTDALDMEILHQLSRGKRSLTDLSGAINVAQMDLAMHMYRLVRQEYVVVFFRNATLDISLTEKGFVTARAMPQQPEPQAQAAADQSAAAAQAATLISGAVTQPQGAPAAQPKKDPLEEIRRIRRAQRMRKIAVVILVVIIIVVVLVLFKMNKLVI